MPSLPQEIRRSDLSVAEHRVDWKDWERSEDVDTAAHIRTTEVANILRVTGRLCRGDQGFGEDGKPIAAGPLSREGVYGRVRLQHGKLVDRRTAKSSAERG